LRIIGGKYRGFRLEFSISDELRPTKDRVKEALFSILFDKVIGATCLDLFAGSGSLGLEALSREAELVDFVDTDCRILRKNLEKLKLDSRDGVYCQSFDKFLKRSSKKYDIIFLDPPWAHLNYFEEALKLIFDNDLLTTTGIIVCEHPKNFKISVDKQKDSRSFGRSVLTLIKHD
jgi:16S rRNA (guanine966-N2)-methyltransferase